MIKQQIQTAKESISNYFKNYSIDNVIIGESGNYDDLNKNIIFDYTALIGISGNYKGGMYVTCKEEFLKSLLKRMIGDDIKAKQDILADLVGEMANAFSGFYQKMYGDRFMISIPHLIIGSSGVKSVQVRLKLPFTYIPFIWDHQESIFVFRIEEVTKN